MGTDGRTVVADFEAGIGTLTRLHAGDVDVVLVVVEPTPKSIEVGVRAAQLAVDKQLGRVVVVANRVRDEDEAARIQQSFPGHAVFPVPDDAAIIRADREGVAPLDLDPDAPAVRTLSELAPLLLMRGEVGPPRGA